MNLTLRFRILGLAALAVLALVFVGGGAYLLSVRLAAQLRAVVVASHAQRNHMMGDMEHDALRGDVNAGLLAGESGDKERAAVAAGEGTPVRSDPATKLVLAA